MTSVVTKHDFAPAAHPLHAALAFAWSAVRSITWREAAFFLFLALVMLALVLAWLLDSLLMGKPVDLAPPVAMVFMDVPFVLAGWAIADRSEGRLPRPARLALGIMAGALVATLCMPPLLERLGIDFSSELVLLTSPPQRIPAWAFWTASFFDALFFYGIGVAALETYRRRVRGQLALEAARQAQARLAREVLESRLAAMQAQVEPHFLFDSLVDVQATYDRDPTHGADVMDRLITYLRVALPRLREAGSTVAAEADLLAAYLAVVSARHGGRPAVHFDIDPATSGLRFSPMLLLPLVQRAMRAVGPAATVPARVQLEVRATARELVAKLRIEAPNLCVDDPELARVRDRLAGLYDGRARLDCGEPAPGTSEFTLCVPR